MRNTSESDPPALDGASTKTQKIGTPTGRRYWIILTRAIWIGLSVHAMFIVLLRRKCNRPVLLLAWIEVIGHYTRVRWPERTVSGRRTPHNVGRFPISY